MKKQNGVTMLTLVITIIILVILSSISINIGVESYKNVKLQNFVSQLKVIQTKVDEIANDKNISIDNIKEYCDAVPEDKITDEIREVAERGGADIADYCYFNKSTLDSVLGLKDLDMEVIINFKTRKVISLNGFKYEGSTYYQQFKTNKEKLIN